MKGCKFSQRPCKCKSVTNLNELSEYKGYVDADIVMIDEAIFRYLLILYHMEWIFIINIL